MRALFSVAALAGLALLTAAALRSGERTPAPVAAAPSADSARITYPDGAHPLIALPDGRHARIHSLLDVRRRMHFGDFEWNEENVPAGPVWVRVDLARQMLSVFRGGHEIGTAVILYGTDGHPTPLGAFPVLEKDKDYWSRSYNAPMRYMLRLTADGVAIHASNVERGYATHGCVGVPPGFARRLFETVGKGDLVVIAGNPAETDAAAQAVS